MYLKSIIETQERSNNKHTRGLSSAFIFNFNCISHLFIVCNLSNLSLYLFFINKIITLLSNSHYVTLQASFTCSKSTIETPEQSVKYV